MPETQRFAAIYSNPPIRVGKPALHEMLLTWLPRLRPSGVAYLVVQRNLGADSLARWFGEQGHEVERISSRRGYRVLAVESAD
jgi:16S rRNA G1207 methylase RsmC